MQGLSKVFVAFTFLVFLTILWLELPRYKRVTFHVDLSRNTSNIIRNTTSPTKIESKNIKRTIIQAEATEILSTTLKTIETDNESKLNVLILGNIGTGSTFVANTLTFYPRTYTNDRPLQYFSKKV